MQNNDVKSLTFDRDFFSFPYEPYDIQLQFMKQLWYTIENKHIGIFESPTGTGKSISLICGALTWLKLHTDEYGLPTELTSEAQVETKELNKHEDIQKEPDWLANFPTNTVANSGKELQEIAKDALAPIEEIRAMNLDAKESKKRKLAYAYNHLEDNYEKHHRASHNYPKKNIVISTGLENDNEAVKHLVASYDSDDYTKTALHYSSSDDETLQANHRQNRKHFFEKLKGNENSDLPITQIIYCSRTHSQISQFINEIKSTEFHNKIRVVTLGSRKNLCIYPNFAADLSDQRLTDKCLDMLQSKASNKKSKKVSKCPYYEKELLTHYKNHALAHIQDIEDLRSLGQDMNICSYFGTREAIPLSQVVALPYSMLLSRDTRSALQLSVKNAIIIIDEAHNLVDAIHSLHSVELTSKQLVRSRRSLFAYFRKYEKRFLGRNKFYIKQLLALLDLLGKCIKRNKHEGDGDGKMMTINDFLFAAHIDHFNLFKLLQYISHSDLSKKLMGFIEWEEAQDAESSNLKLATEQKIEVNQFDSRHISPLQPVSAFLSALTNATNDGRVLIQPPNIEAKETGKIKFILLNPAPYFQDIVKDARTVILAGGTMQPVAQVISSLFSPSTTPIEQPEIDIFSCGHVIPPENLIGFPITCGPSSIPFEFTFANRLKINEMLDDLARLVNSISSVIPGGIVIFFPSYQFEHNCVTRWTNTGAMQLLNLRKLIFREPKRSDELAQVLASYSSEVQRNPKKGAILLSVVGGKMSEGINFKDDLARCVMMVGMPYPNVKDPELVEKRAYLEAKEPGSGRELYENLCMKAVNQSIGRAIRHQHDYASILLLDRRYASIGVKDRLPKWIQKRIQPVENSQPFSYVQNQLEEFYRNKL